MTQPQGFRWLWLPTRLAVYSRDDWRCCACGLEATWEPTRKWSWKSCRSDALSVDHVVPRARGGTNAPENLLTLCVGCNAEKKDRELAAWRPDLVAVVREQIARGIDRQLGRWLAALLDVKWAERERTRCRREAA